MPKLKELYHVEQKARKAAEQTADRLARLQNLTAALCQALTSQQVADAIIIQGLAALDANGGVVAVRSEEGTEFINLRVMGYPREIRDTWRRFPADAPMPIADAVGDKRPVILETLDEREARYPHLDAIQGQEGEGALVALPILQGRIVGGLQWSFPTSRTFSGEDQAFMLTLASLCGQALERARLYDAERLAREKAERELAERGRVEEALAASKRRLQAVFDNTLDAILLADDQARYVAANPAACELLGYGREELLQRTVWDITPPPDADVGRALWQAFIQGGKQGGEYQVVRKDGTTVLVEYRAAANILPGLHLSVLRDVSDRKQAEQSLRENEEQFHTLADSIPQLAWMTRPDGHIVWYNQRWYDYTGMTPEQMEGWGWQAVHDPAELPRVLANWKAALARGEPWEDTFPLRRHDGQMRWHLSRAFPVRDDQGHVVRWFGTNTDITERLQMEEALKEADRHKTDFLAMLGHELRSPLAPIRNAAQFLGLAGASESDRQRAREVIDRQVQQMSRLVDDLLEISRISRGKLVLRKEPVELASVVGRAVETSRPLIEARRHQFTVQVRTEGLWLEADSTRLAQALVNLLNNAAKYTQEGGHIWLTVEQERGEAVIRVRDTGLGIPKEMLPRIFDLFTQVNRPVDHSEGGLGIGLTLVKNLVESHGGTVQALSDGPGKGSEFVVRLPISKARPTLPVEASNQGGTVPSPVRRILLVDDNADSAETLAMLLRLTGHQVRTAHDGQAALEIARTFQPEVVFLDIGLPGMDGYEVARRLRKRPGSEQVHLVALTGWGQEEDRRRSREAGFDHFLVKPVDPEDLYRLLARPDVVTSGP